MSEEEQPKFERLKTFSGLIHRQPIFVPKKLDLDSYHISFFDINGEKLNDDSPIPDFVSELPNLLPSITQHHKALLTLPESWQHALLEMEKIDMDLTIDVNGSDKPASVNVFTFAGYADLAIPRHTETLLIDMAKLDQATLSSHIQTWRQQHQLLCATNVNDVDTLSFCTQQQLDLLQGQFYTLPIIDEKHTIAPSTQTLMSLLVKLQEPDVEPEDLAETINMDVTLSYKLLRLINSAFFGLPREVSSTKQAVMMLGLNKVKTWASLLCLSGMDDKPNELRVIAMVRARMCELLAKYYKGQPESFFAAGLFSTLDALLDKPLSSITEKLPLADELKTALLDHEGAAGRALRDVICYERRDWQTLNNSAIPKEILARTYLDAINWAKELNAQIQD
jgi:EAL and modified HD-GYP domain-containing signal transduction protein